jgi:hypothetical protein
MGMPGFTGEVSLHRPSEHYRMVTMGTTFLTEVVPAQRLALPPEWNYSHCIANGPDNVDYVTWARFCSCLWQEDRGLLACMAELVRSVNVGANVGARLV